MFAEWLAAVGMQSVAARLPVQRLDTWAALFKLGMTPEEAVRQIQWEMSFPRQRGGPFIPTPWDHREAAPE